MKISFLTAIAVFGALSVLPSGAQTLTHRYSFNGNATDSIGGAIGTIVGNVTFQTDPASGKPNGNAVFGGGTSASNPSYIKLPNSVVSGLQNATIEIFTTNFNTPGGAFQALFSVGTAYPNTSNYILLAANRSGAGIGTGARRANAAETVVASVDPLPDGISTHVVDLVYSGFTTVGSTGTETIYFDGVQVAQGQTVCSFAYLAAAGGGIGTVGIGGGSPFNDPTFIGSINEFRIFSGALTPAQIASEVDAGPATVATIATVTGRIALGGLSDLTQIAPGVIGPDISVQFRVPGTTTAFKTTSVILTPVGAGSPFGTFTVNNVPLGSADVAIKGDKQLRVVLPSVNITGITTLPDVTLETGDANNNNMVDIGDFGLLVNAFGSSVSDGTGFYNSSTDFDYNGLVDIGDFGLLVNGYGDAGAL